MIKNALCIDKMAPSEEIESPTLRLGGPITPIIRHVAPIQTSIETGMTARGAPN